MSGTLLVGDVHGCADELGRLLKKAKPRRVVLLGDLFTRGPDPVGVWKLIRKWNAEAVLGNHDEFVLQNWKPGKQLPRRCFKWLKKRPLLLRGQGWVAVHAGVHPTKGVAGTKRKHALYMKHWDKRYWWKHYRGDDLVVHGHSVAHGLQRKRRVIGLDTDCARGGRLTGLMLERNEVVSVRSRV